MKYNLCSCRISELDFSLFGNVECFKYTYKIIKAGYYSDFMTLAFSSADPTVNHQILFLHRVHINFFSFSV